MEVEPRASRYDWYSRSSADSALRAARSPAISPTAVITTIIAATAIRLVLPHILTAIQRTTFVMPSAAAAGAKVDEQVAAAKKQVKQAQKQAQKQVKQVKKSAARTAQKVQNAATQLKGEFEKMDEKSQQKALVGGGVLLGVLLAAGVKQGLAIFALGAVLYATKPPAELGSFTTFFKPWFLNVFYPSVAERAKAELEKRAAKEKSVVGALLGSLKSWLVDKTKALGGSVMYGLVRATPGSFAFTDLGICTMAVVRIGPVENHSLLRFFGVCNVWFASPIALPIEESVSAVVDLATSASTASKAL